MFNFLIFLLFLIFIFWSVWSLLNDAWKKGFLFGSLNFVLFEIQFPKIAEPAGIEEDRKQLARMEQFYHSLGKMLSKRKGRFGHKPYLIFEMVIPEKEKEARFYLALPKQSQSAVQNQIRGFFPEAEIKAVNNFSIFNKKGVTGGAILKMEHGQSLALQTYKKLNGSTLDLINNAVNSLKETGEGMAFQILARSDKENLFEVNIRILVSAETQAEVDQILSDIESAFAQFEYPDLNSFYSFRPRGEILKRLIYNFSFRLFNKKEAIRLSAEELTGIFHWPIINMETSRIKFLKSKESSPPDIPSSYGVLLGKNNSRGVETEIRLNPVDRRRHLYVAGKNNAGKDSFLKNLIKQDLEIGAGIGIIDASGHLIESVLNSIPDARRNDIVLFDPTDSEAPIGLNLFEAETPAEKNLIAKEAMAILQKIFFIEHLEPVFRHKMKNALLTLMSDEGNPGTLMDLSKILEDPIFARQFLIKVVDPSLRSFWEKELPKIAFPPESASHYLISKIKQLSDNSILKNIIGKNHSGINFDDIVNNGKILLVNLPSEKMSETDSALLGSIVVSKLQMAAFRRSGKQYRANRNFHLYIDEFQNFTTDSIAGILAKTCQHKIDFVLSHQSFGQLTEKARQAIFDNIGSLAVFRVHQKDASVLAEHFHPIFNAADLANVDNNHAYIKLLISGAASTPFNINITE